jgi:L-ribulose-5-phosphate 4-epimerase
MLEELKENVLKANLLLLKYNLIALTWGNVSGIDRTKELVVIKPSGLDYSEMKLNDMVVVNMEGKVIEGKLRPSSDTLTHIEIYKAFKNVGGITHSHSEYATVFAQACMEIECFGTTHADNFNGPIPVTRFLTEEEVNSNYELNTGKIIVERFNNLDPNSLPGILVAGHAPFTWGRDPEDSVKNNLVLERVAKMAINSLRLKPDLAGLPAYILKKHHSRKHGKDAYYGQK